MSSHTAHEVAEELADELESWKFRHWFTPSNVVTIVTFIILGTLGYASITTGIAQNTAQIEAVDEAHIEKITEVKADVMIEKEKRISQIDKSERRLNTKIEKLEQSIEKRFDEQKADLRNIENLLIRMIQDDGS